LAGLAAAVALAERGVPVTLLESRNRLGGRASSFVDQETGETIDNCQHVSLGCCTNLQHFCRTVGTDRLFRTERELTFIGPDGSISRFTGSWLPAPLHLYPAFRRLRYLSHADRAALARGLRALARSDATALNGEAFDAWLRRHGQGEKLRTDVWQVVLVSALSESLDRIDVAHARKVFVDAFLAHRRGWEVRIPTVPLDELYGPPVLDWLSRHGAAVRLQASVRDVELSDGRAAAVRLRDGERIAGAQVVLAVPQHRVLTLLPQPLQNHADLSGIARLESAPISSVHLWFDRPIMDLPHAVLVGRLSQWVFNRTLLQGSRAEGQGSRESRVESRESRAREAMIAAPSQLSTLDSQLPTHSYQVVISASRALSTMTPDEVIAAVVRELASIWPATAAANVRHARLVTEHRAVFSVTPGVDAFRPPQQTSVDNLHLAGDWTRTGWPGTMEGAVRSGYLAAESVLRRLGRAARVLQPDLPVAPLARWLLGITRPPSGT
jgi:squalene-associated FAD-dependent desaturase